MPYGGSKKYVFGKCKVLISQKSSYSTKTLYAKFELVLRGVRMGANSLKFWKYYGGQKMQLLIFFRFGVREFRLDERIPNQVSKLKLITFDPLLVKKTKHWQNSPICQISTVFRRKGVKYCTISILRPIWNSLILAKLSEPNMKEIEKFIFWPPIVQSFNELASKLSPDRSNSNFV